MKKIKGIQVNALQKIFSILNMRMLLRPFSGVVAALVLLVQLIGVSAVAEESLPGFGTVAVEDFNGTEIAAARALLPVMAEYDIAVTLHWKASDLDNAERWAFVQEAQALGVEVRPWLLLDEEDGYWANSSNAALFASKARELASLWTDTYHLTPTSFGVDMEMRIERFRELSEKLFAPIPDFIGIAWLMAKGVNRNEFSLATQTYAKLVKDLHKQGWKVAVSTLPAILDDYSDGDDGIRQAMGIPIDGIEWDQIAIQTYRTVFSRQTGGLPLTPFFVYDYGKMAKRVWGSKASLDIGLTGSGIDDSPVFVDPNELKRDADAAKAAGFDRKHVLVYNLQGIIDQPPMDAWLQPPSANPRKPRPDLGTPALHFISIVLDFLF